MSRSLLREQGLRPVLAELETEIRDLFQADATPWVIGYSGGKDSTAVLQLIWTALHKLPSAAWSKSVHVICTDTLVENPIIAAWVVRSLELMQAAAHALGIPLQVHRLVPELSDRFWVNLIGRGYPAPRHKFRWCTERLKIKPSNRFMRELIRRHGEALLALGTRKAESSQRAHRMTELEGRRTRARLSPNASLPGSRVYTPIEDWSNDDVWLYLMQCENPWGLRNKDLLGLYQGASPDAECPLVVDTSTPSCGGSRFGCWVCTLVDQDRSMAAMIRNDDEKEWLLPLLELRNDLDVGDDRNLRDFRRMAGQVQLYHDSPIPGPYTQSAREQWLRRLLEAQRRIRQEGPLPTRQVELITLEELNEIRRIWVMDKHEIEDTLPSIYQAVLDEPFPGGPLEEERCFGQAELQLLRQACDGEDLRYQLLRELLDVESRHRTMARRAGLFDALEAAFQRNAFSDIEEATFRARVRREATEAAKQGDLLQVRRILEFVDGETEDSAGPVLLARPST